MKKLVLLLIILCLFFKYIEVSFKKNDKIKFNLNDEVGIVTLKLDNSNSLLIKYKDKYILYLLDFIDKKNLETNIKLFTDKINYTYMNNNYNISLNNRVDNINIEDLTINNGIINYKDNKVCINKSTDCDYVFIFKNDILLNDNIKAIFYSNDLNKEYIDYINSYKIDKYIISNQTYNLITINNSKYKVTNLVK